MYRQLLTIALARAFCRPVQIKMHKLRRGLLAVLLLLLWLRRLERRIESQINSVKESVNSTIQSSIVALINEIASDAQEAIRLLKEFVGIENQAFAALGGLSIAEAVVALFAAGAVVEQQIASIQSTLGSGTLAPF
jgi:hypothetical protein